MEGWIRIGEVSLEPAEKHLSVWNTVSAYTYMTGFLFTKVSPLWTHGLKKLMQMQRNKNNHLQEITGVEIQERIERQHFHRFSFTVSQIPVSPSVSVTATVNICPASYPHFVIYISSLWEGAGVSQGSHKLQCIFFLQRAKCIFLHTQMSPTYIMVH